MSTADAQAWRIRCVTCDCWREWILRLDADAPTTCPVNSAHTVVEDSAAVTGQPFALVNVDDDGNLKNTPSTELEGGMQPVTPMNGPYEAANYRQSWEMEVPADSIGILDVYVGDYLVGPTGVCWLEGGAYEFYTEAPKGTAVYFSIVDRDGILLIPGTEIPIFDALGIPRTKLTGLTGITGTPEAGHIVHGATSGAHAEVISVSGDVCEVTFHAGPFDDGEALSFKDGETEEATATLGTWVEGGVYTAQTSVRDEWVRGYAAQDITPGGAKKLPAGLYLRAKVYNADQANPAELCIRFKVLTE